MPYYPNYPGPLAIYCFLLTLFFIYICFYIAASSYANVFHGNTPRGVIPVIPAHPRDHARSALATEKIPACPVNEFRCEASIVCHPTYMRFNIANCRRNQYLCCPFTYICRPTSQSLSGYLCCPPPPRKCTAIRTGCEEGLYECTLTNGGGCCPAGWGCDVRGCWPPGSVVPESIDERSGKPVGSVVKEKMIGMPLKDARVSRELLFSKDRAGNKARGKSAVRGESKTPKFMEKW